VFSTPKQDKDVVEDAIQELKRRRRKRGAGYEASVLGGVLLNQKQVLRKRLVKRDMPSLLDRAGPPASAAAQQREVQETLKIKDPIFKSQWHLFNTVEVGNDLNVTGVWLQGITGKNATVCILDDGLDMYSDDLKANYFAKGSYDFNLKIDEPKPRLEDDLHGTRCAGEIAAGRNDVCGVGVAYDARIAGIRILSAPINDLDESEAILYQYQENDIYSCSWGPPDDGRTMQEPGIIVKRAFVTAIQKGRGGKGTIYVLAAGNGALQEDNCNFDGYANSLYTITVGAIDRRDLHPWYSEKCSAQLVVTYSSGSVDAIHTTDVGKNKCTESHGGTSAAAPLASGVYALVLSIRPDLHWRDLQWLQVMSAVPIHEDDGDWQDTPLGKKFSHQYGYGKLDTYGIVEAAKNWTSVKPQAWYFSPWMHVKHPIPQGDKGLASTFQVTEQALKDANLERLEHVQVTMNVNHTRRGDLSVELRSPNGIVSHLSVTRKSDEAPEGYVDWSFMSVAHWGEPAVGNWTVIVKDTNVNNHSGNFTDWKLRLWGECIDAASQKMIPLPTEHDDDDHDDKTDDHHIHTTDVAVPTSTGEPMETPTDHPDRPVIPKPTSASTSQPASNPTSTAPFEPPLSAAPTSTSTASPDTFLPSPFPTFGVSKRTQIWIYGSLALITIFCSSLAGYFYLARRRRLRQQNPRDDYEFEVLDDVDDDGAGGGARGVDGAAAGRKKSRRAGELYDAFAGESDEELFSEEGREEGRYRDDEAFEEEKRREAGA